MDLTLIDIIRLNNRRIGIWRNGPQKFLIGGFDFDSYDSLQGGYCSYEEAQEAAYQWLLARARDDP